MAAWLGEVEARLTVDRSLAAIEEGLKIAHRRHAGAPAPTEDSPMIRLVLSLLGSPP